MSARLKIKKKKHFVLIKPVLDIKFRSFYKRKKTHHIEYKVQYVILLVFR